MPPTRYSESDWAYAAGIIDGEGYVGIKRVEWTRYRSDRKTPGYHARIVVRMVQSEAVDVLCAMAEVKRRSHRASAVRGRPLVEFGCTDAKAERFMLGVQPYLRLKARSVQACLDLRALQAHGLEHRTKVIGYRDFTNPHGTVRRVATKVYSDEFIERCESLYLLCKTLNARGIDE